jgi:hypothetical protein
MVDTGFTNESEHPTGNDVALNFAEPPLAAAADGA